MCNVKEIRTEDNQVEHDEFTLEGVETIKNNIELIIKECIKDIDIDTLNYVTEKHHNKIMYELHDKIWR